MKTITKHIHKSVQIGILFASLLLALPLLTTGCKENPTGPSGARDLTNQDGQGTPCGTTTCNNTQKCENDVCVAKNGGQGTPCGTTTCNDTQKCENDVCVPKDTTQTGGCKTNGCSDLNMLCNIETDTCVSKNEGDGTCSGKCTGDQSCTNGECVHMCNTCGISPHGRSCVGKNNELCQLLSTGWQCDTPRCRPIDVVKCTPKCAIGLTCVKEGNPPEYSCKKGSNCGGKCTTGQICNETTQQCVEQTPCSGVKCGNGEVCNSQTGACEASGTACPTFGTTQTLSFTVPDNSKPLVSVATIKENFTQDHDTTIGTTFSCNGGVSTDESKTGYRTFAFTINKYSAIELQLKDLTDGHPMSGNIDIALFKGCGNFEQGCMKDIKFDNAGVGKPASGQSALNSLEPGTYYLVVKYRKLLPANAPRPWEMTVTKTTFDYKDGCTKPETRDKSTCMNSDEDYGYCELVSYNREIKKRVYSCVTSSDASQKGCFMNGSEATCYGNSCLKPIIVDGSNNKTINFANGKKKLIGTYLEGEVNYSNATCAPATSPADIDKYKTNYIIQINNLKPNSRLVIKTKTTRKTPSPVGSASIVRIQESCGLNQECLLTSEDLDPNNYNGNTITYPTSTTATVPSTLYVILNMTSSLSGPSFDIKIEDNQ